jgi:SAM-dependent methyltransferase
MAAQIQEDLSPKLVQLIQADSRFLTDLKRGLVTKVAVGDGMNSGDGEYYLKCGRSALDCINISLKYAIKNPEKLESVLDFGCGFGRITRWLLAAFPSARLVGMDVDAKAVEATRALYNIPVHQIDRDWKNTPENERFDLIWVGSLFTHIGEDQSKRLLYLLLKLLKPGGVLATTIHGNYVLGRLTSREKTYNLDEAGVTQMLSQFEKTQYGFASYDKHTRYGVSVTTTQKFMDIGVSVKLKPLVFIDRGWVRHQDFVAFYR